MSRVKELHPDPVGFGLFRILKDGTGKFYTPVEFERGRDGAAAFLRRVSAMGMVKDSTADSAPGSAGVLDVYNADGDIIQDYDVPTRQGFTYIKTRLGMRVESPDQQEVSVR